MIRRQIQIIWLLKPRSWFAKNGYKVDVKILGELRPFLERLDSMNEHKESLEEGLRFTPDPRYPDFTRDEMVKHVILNLCI